MQKSRAAVIPAKPECTERTQRAPQYVIESPLRTLSICGQGVTDCSPDKFQLTVFLTSSKSSVEEAETSVKKRSDYVLQVLRNHGMNGDCVKMSSDVYHDDHLVTCKSSIKVQGDDLARVTRARSVVMEKLASAVQCSDICYSISFKHQMDQREEAFRLAVMNAKSKGLSVAKCLGVGLGPVLTLVEESQEERPLVDSTSGNCDNDPLVSSSLAISCNVSAVFELYTDNNTSNKKL